jgi:hypothetical protein
MLSLSNWNESCDFAVKPANRVDFQILSVAGRLCDIAAQKTSFGFSHTFGEAS